MQATNLLPAPLKNHIQYGQTLFTSAWKDKTFVQKIHTAFIASGAWNGALLGAAAVTTTVSCSILVLAALRFGERKETTIVSGSQKHTTITYELPTKTTSAKIALATFCLGFSTPPAVVGAIGGGALGAAVGFSLPYAIGVGAIYTLVNQTRKIDSWVE